MKSNIKPQPTQPFLNECVKLYKEKYTTQFSDKEIEEFLCDFIFNHTRGHLTPEEVIFKFEH